MVHHRLFSYTCLKHVYFIDFFLVYNQLVTKIKKFKALAIKCVNLECLYNLDFVMHFYRLLIKIVFEFCLFFY